MLHTARPIATPIWNAVFTSPPAGKGIRSDGGLPGLRRLTGKTLCTWGNRCHERYRQDVVCDRGTRATESASHEDGLGRRCQCIALGTYVHRSLTAQ